VPRYTLILVLAAAALAQHPPDARFTALAARLIAVPANGTRNFKVASQIRLTIFTTFLPSPQRFNDLERRATYSARIASTGSTRIALRAGT